MAHRTAGLSAVVMAAVRHRPALGMRSRVPTGLAASLMGMFGMLRPDWEIEGSEV
jgi:hypothetical protein